MDDTDAVAETLWTSPRRGILGMEFCSILNAIIRADVDNEISSAVVIIRAINNRRVRRQDVSAVEKLVFPPGGILWRGGGFRDIYRTFFEGNTGKKIRVPGFLACSQDKVVAEEFCNRAHRAHPRALWKVMLDPRGETQLQYRCKHMAYVTKSLIIGEGEHLFAPYSVFTVVETEWAEEIMAPNKIVMLAAIDNSQEDEGLPLAPWY